MKVLVLLVMLACDGVLSASTRMEDSARSDPDGRGELDDMLELILLNSTENVKKITTSFTFDQGEVKLCIPVSYAINCTGQDYSFRVIWTSIDPSDYYESVLLAYASINWEIFGFQWREACDISTNNTLLLNIGNTSSMPQCGNDQRSINESLTHLTTKVSITCSYFCI